MRKHSNLWITGIWLGAALFLFTVLPPAATAQDVGAGIATANVLAALAVTATHDLDFGDVLQGVQKTADKTVDAEAGIFQIVGAAGREISMYLTLPDYLWNTNPGFEDRMTIAFPADAADIDTTAAGTPAVHGLGAIIDLNPHGLPDTPIGAADNTLQLYLGGNVYPTVDQRSGTYLADIILTVSYTGL